MRLLLWIGGIVAFVSLVGCDRNTGGTADQSNKARGSGSAPTDYRATNAPDNSGINKRDRNDATLTPLDQGTSESDRELTRRIRRAITEDSQLSVAAHNIKIMTDNGKVTLRGPVKTAQEKQQVDAILKQLRISTVDNQLEVKTSN